MERKMKGRIVPQPFLVKDVAPSGVRVYGQGKPHSLLEDLVGTAEWKMKG